VEVSWFDVREVALGPADLAELDGQEAARAAAFVFPADRHRYQVAHVMLRRVLASHLGADPAGLVFAREPCPTCGGPSGRPVLAGLPALAAEPGLLAEEASPGPSYRSENEPLVAAGLNFSLAHSGDAVAIAVAGRPVGVDVEREPTGCVCSLASAMHPGDAALVADLAEPERHAALIGWWVRAEAVLKCAGTGIAHGMDAFAVLGGPAQGGVPGPRPAAEPGAAGWATAFGRSFAALPAPAGYQAAIALNRP
jgi:4'-phosphopantetheinyl transferase